MSFDIAIREAVASSLREQLPTLLAETLPKIISESVKSTDDELLTTAQLAKETNTADITWVMMRVEGRGPRFCKIGRSVRYRRSDITEYLRYNAVRRPGRPPAEPPVMEVETTGSYHGRGKRTTVKTREVK
jgi:predicted DNA-binding transcriptional regulator AlpA